MERDIIRKHLHQLFSPEYRWRVAGIVGSSEYQLSIEHDSRGSASIRISTEVTREDLHYAGNALIDKLHKQ